MTTDDNDLLFSCPFCGDGQTIIVENGQVWLGMYYGPPVSVSVRHWCSGTHGPSRMLERVGKDRASAIAAWNQRVTPLPTQLAKDIRRLMHLASLGGVSESEEYIALVASIRKQLGDA